MSDNELKEQIARLNQKKQTLIKLMQSLDFDVQRIKRGKSTAWQFEYDQGVYKGSNQYIIRQDNLTALTVANVIDEERLNISASLENVLFKFFERSVK